MLRLHRRSRSRSSCFLGPGAAFLRLHGPHGRLFSFLCPTGWKGNAQQAYMCLTLMKTRNCCWRAFSFLACARCLNAFRLQRFLKKRACNRDERKDTDETACGRRMAGIHSRCHAVPSDFLRADDQRVSGTETYFRCLTYVKHENLPFASC